MSTLNITAEELKQLKDMKDEGKIAEAWNFLGGKGDAYAYLAGAIVSDNTSAMSTVARLFYEMVRSQWENTGAGGAWGGKVFKDVGQRHLGNYLTLLGKEGSSGAYVLPNTEQIEASYKEALNWSGLPPITAIDSLFSVLDYNAGNGNGKILEGDFSWAQFMDIANDWMGGPRWEADRIKFNSEVFKNDFDSATAIVTFGRTLINSLERYGAGAAAQISPLAPAYWAFKLVDGALDYTMMDFARRQAAQVAFKRMDATLTAAAMDTLLDAAGNDDRVAFGTLIDRLGKALNVALPVSNATPTQIFDNVKTLSDWRGNNAQPLTISLADPAAIVDLAKGAGADAIAWRYALAELNPFAVIGADYAPHNNGNSLDLYTPTGGGQVTESWIADRAQLLAGVMEANTKDSGSGKALTTETASFSPIWFEDKASGITLQQINSENGSVDGPRYRFGASDADTLEGSGDSDHLYGMVGDDTLEGKGGNDYLEGGQGNDTYYADDGDTLFDSDGQGRIIDDGYTLSGGQLTAPNQWQDGNGNVYSLVDAGAGKQDLLINAGTAHLVVKDHRNGALGIHLAGEVAPTPFVQSGNGITVTGDRMPYQMAWDYYLWLSNPAWPYLFDSNGNIVRTNTPQPFYADKVFDTAGDDKIYAGEGLNVINAYNGGNNHIETGLNDDYITGGSGRDRVYSGGMTDTVSTGADDDIVYGEGGRDVIAGDAGNDFLSGGAMADAISGGDGNDQIYGGDSVTWLHALSDSGSAAAGQGDLLAGDAGDDVVIGDAANDALLGGEGGDTIAGREGDDILLGDAGLVFVAPPLSEFDSIIGATRWPMGPYLNFHSPFTTAPMLNIQFEKNDLGVASANRYEVKLSSLTNLEAPRDNWMTPAITGGDDYLYGGSGDDWLFGELGDDLLDGGAGSDVLDGGAGNDLLKDGGGDTVIVFGLGYGNDSVSILDKSVADQNTVHFRSGMVPDDVVVTRTGSGKLDLLLSIRGTSDTLTIEGYFNPGYSSNPKIDVLQFADGATWDSSQIEAMTRNNPPVVVRQILDQVASEDAPLSFAIPVDAFSDNDAGDAVSLSASLSSGAPLPSWLGFDSASGIFSGTPASGDVGNLSLKVTAMDLAGESVSQNFSLTVGAITGVTLMGTAGNDVLTGTRHNDTIDGGAGRDRMVGGAGNDIYTVDNTGDAVVELAGEGTDSIVSSISLTLAANVERLVLAGSANLSGTGNALDNIITGNVGGNSLNGGVGADTMIGGAGNDTYRVDHVGDVVTEQVNEGTDRVISTTSYILGDNVENLTLAGVDTINGTGNELNNTLVGNVGSNIISGLGGNDSLTGGDANDTLLGGAGTDTLKGGLGADIMEGGADNDTYYVDDVSDVVTERVSEGTDRVISTISYALPDNVENLTLSSADIINGSGNALANSLKGNAAVNLLNGGDGNDSINGVAGLDFLEGMAGNDSLTDTVGNGYFNGGSGVDKLVGGVDSDLFLGGIGNDSIATGDGNDIIAFNKGDGYDAITGGAGSKTVSLGGGLAYSDLKLRKSGNDLVLDTAAGEGMAFKNWYVGTNNQNVLTLQVMAEAMAAFDTASLDPLLNRKVQDFDFKGLAGGFDAARIANPGLTSWALSNALANFHLAASDSAALGGDLVYQYGKNGTLSGIGLGAAQQVMDDSNFGAQAQTLQPLLGLLQGASRLA